MSRTGHAQVRGRASNIECASIRTFMEAICCMCQAGANSQACAII